MATFHDITTAGRVQGWVSSSCTLPTAERPVRVAEFDQLFASAVRTVERIAPTSARLLLDGGAAARARELADRETDCCSFFDFTFGDQDGLVAMVVTVPPAHAPVLAAWTARAATVAGLDRG